MATLTGDVITLVREAGARPCLRCGQFTSAWCEGCALPSPAAICTECDRSHLLCFSCASEGKIWSEIRRQPDPEKFEISGYQDDSGVFHPLDPPLELPAAEVPRRDGVFDIAYISDRIAEYEEQLKKSSGAKSKQSTGAKSSSG